MPVLPRAWKALFLGLADGCALVHVACAASLSPVSVMPLNRVVMPFGYGPVTQLYTTAAGRTGASQCQGLNHALMCLSVSGGGSCGAPVPAGQLVSCGPPKIRPVDESAFFPVNCNGKALGDGAASGLVNDDDFCLMAGYMPQRSLDTIYQYDDFVRLGVNRRFGGMVMELYGTDKLDRILQNPGGGIQLSLWAFTPDYTKAYPENYYAVADFTKPNWRDSFDPTGYATGGDCVASHPGQTCQLGAAGPNLLNSGSQPYPCAPNGDGAAAPLNPIQGWSPNCDVGQPQGAVDSVTFAAPGALTVTKSNPSNFTRSDTFSGLTWRQTSQVIGPYALLSYTMVGPISGAPNTSWQEIPALLLHDGAGAYAYYYTGTRPYADATGPVSRVTTSSDTSDIFQLPNRQGPFSTGADAVLSEDWVSTCDAKENHCITVASFSQAAQEIALQPKGLIGAYFGIHGFFSLTNHLNVKTLIAVFPYRFDDVIMGLSVRQWIYQLRNQLPTS